MATMIRQLCTFLLLVSCRGLMPGTTQKSKIRRRGLNSRFNSQIPNKAEIENALLSTKDVNEGNIIDRKHTDIGTKPSFWKPKSPKSWWKERILLKDLNVGQELSGHVVEEYLEGKTGPKLYFECGVGRTDRNGNWSIVNGMLRLDRGKASVNKKYAARYRKQDEVQLYVSRVQKECGRLEVCTKMEDVQKYIAEPKISVTSLEKNQEVVGKVVKLLPYGAIIDIGANVQGLLHITNVARIMNQYIDKEKGLKAAGIEKGAKLRLMIESVEKRRLSLDFAYDVKEDAMKEHTELKEEPESFDEYYSSRSNNELEAWAAYGEQEAQKAEHDDGEEVRVSIDQRDENGDYDDDDDEYEDRYDEEMDIESQLGLDMY